MPKLFYLTVLTMKPLFLHRAISSIIPGILLIASMVFLSLYSIYVLLSFVTNLTQLVRASKGLEQVIDIRNVTVYANGSIFLLISNTGKSTIGRVSNLDVIISYLDLSGYQVSYLLRFNQEPLPGCWRTVEVCVEGTTMCFPYYSREFLKPGELILMRGLLPTLPIPGSWGYVVVVTPTSHKAERAFSVVEVS